MEDKKENCSESDSAIDPSFEIEVGDSSCETDNKLIVVSLNSEGDTVGDPSSKLVVHVHNLSSDCDTTENPSLEKELDNFFTEVFASSHSKFSPVIDSLSSDDSDSDSSLSTLSETDDLSSDLNYVISDENILISEGEKAPNVEDETSEISSMEFRIFDSLTIHSAKSLPDTISNIGESNIKVKIPPFTLEGSSDITSRDSCKPTEDAGINVDRGSLEILDYTLEITEELIASLLKRFKNKRYNADSKNREDEDILSNCLHLFQKDYECQIICNIGGTLSKRYPSQIIIPIKEKKLADDEHCNYNESCASNLKAAEYRKLAHSSRHSRCRTRFAVPVMLLDGKFICRAGTLSVRKGASVEQLNQPKEPKAKMAHDGIIAQTKNKIDTMTASTSNVVSSFTTLVKPNSMNLLKDQDVDLLKYLGVSYICDLMVEDRKIHTGIRVSSSEKANKEKYEGFEILQMPYPGCEFFKKYHEANRNPKGLKYDWDQKDVTTEFQLPEGFSLRPPAADFTNYKEWDLVRLTKEYLLLQLRVITTGNGGFLVHCVCGWDRTPIFISLLRLSLWADGWIHQTLTPFQMAYLTLGYDWYLFGHDLPERLLKKEEVMHFCFNFIPEIASDDFSMTREWHNRSEESKDNRRAPPFNPSERKEKLLQVQKLLLRLYDEQLNVQLKHDSNLRTTNF